MSMSIQTIETFSKAYTRLRRGNEGRFNMLALALNNRRERGKGWSGVRGRVVGCKQNGKAVWGGGVA